MSKIAETVFMTAMTVIFGLIMCLSQNPHAEAGQLIATALSAGSCGFLSTPTAEAINRKRREKYISDEAIANLVFYFYSIVVLWGLFFVNHILGI